MQQVVAAGEGEAWDEEATSGRTTHSRNWPSDLDDSDVCFPWSSEAFFVSWASILERACERRRRKSLHAQVGVNIGTKVARRRQV